MMLRGLDEAESVSFYRQTHEVTLATNLSDLPQAPLAQTSGLDPHSRAKRSGVFHRGEV